jgi:hypothetical protein
MGRTKKRETWLTKSGQHVVDYTLHPGAVLSHYIAWQRPAGGYATIPDPEPDTINVAVLAKQPVDLKLPHVYHARPRSDQRFWISFGRADDPKQTLAAVTDPWAAYWINPKAAQPRPYIHQPIPTFSLAKDIPAGERWRYIDKICDD